MTPRRSDHGFVRMPDAEFEAILTRAAEEGAKRALADVGLDGDEAALDIRDLRSLVDCIRLVRRTAMQTAVRMITTGVMLALARVMGETAPLLILVGYAPFINFDMFKGEMGSLPGVMVADEPTASLDTESARAVAAPLRNAGAVWALSDRCASAAWLPFAARVPGALAIVAASTRVPALD